MNLDLAPTNQARCSRCKTVIQKGELKVTYPSAYGNREITRSLCLAHGISLYLEALRMDIETLEKYLGEQIRAGELLEKLELIQATVELKNK